MAHTKSTALQGDATTETKNWRGASGAVLVGTTYPVLLRGGGFFGYNDRSGGQAGVNSSRVVVVCGSGLLYDG